MSIDGHKSVWAFIRKKRTLAVQLSTTISTNSCLEDSIRDSFVKEKFSLLWLGVKARFSGSVITQDLVRRWDEERGVRRADESDDIGNA
jgi:hypothetical protein